MRRFALFFHIFIVVLLIVLWSDRGCCIMWHKSFLPSVCLICWEAIVNIGCIIPLFHCIGSFFVVVTLEFLPFLRNATIEHMNVCVCMCLRKYLMKAVTLTSEQGHTAKQYRVVLLLLLSMCFVFCSSFSVLYLNMF